MPPRSSRSTASMPHAGGGHVRALAGAVLCALVGGSPAGAVTFSAALDPIRMQVQPGQVHTALVRLTLDPKEPRTHFKGQVEDWWRSEDGRQSFYTAPGTLARSCGPWVTVNPVEAAVSGGQTLTVRVTVAVPATVEPGGYWCALTLDEIPDPLAPADEGVAVKFLSSVSTGIYVSVGEIRKDVQITAVDFAGDQVSVAVRNTGNTPVPIEGRVVFLRPESDEAVASVPLPRGVLLLDPIPVLRLAADLPSAQALPAGQYLVRVLLDIGVEYYVGAQRQLEVQRARPVALALP